jgi:hypothetical protein
MIISINQPAYMPWLGYFNRIVKSDLHIVLDHVQFEKNSVTNRNKILLNQEPLWLTVPVLTKGKSEDLSINSLMIDNKSNWRKKHTSSITQVYSKSPYWVEFKDKLDAFFLLDSNALNNVLKDNLIFFMHYLGIQTPILFSSAYDFKEKKSDLVLEICLKLNAKKYLSGPFGRDYLELDKFRDHGIDVIFDEYIHPIYPQNSKQFVPYLSCLDLIANCGKQSLKVLTNV